MFWNLDLTIVCMLQHFHNSFPVPPLPSTMTTKIIETGETWGVIIAPMTTPIRWVHPSRAHFITQESLNLSVSVCLSVSFPTSPIGRISANRVMIFAFRAVPRVLFSPGAGLGGGVYLRPQCGGENPIPQMEIPSIHGDFQWF